MMISLVKLLLQRGRLSVNKFLLSDLDYSMQLIWPTFMISLNLCDLVFYEWVWSWQKIVLCVCVYPHKPDRCWNLPSVTQLSWTWVGFSVQMGARRKCWSWWRSFLWETRQLKSHNHSGSSAQTTAMCLCGTSNAHQRGTCLQTPAAVGRGGERPQAIWAWIQLPNHYPFTLRL